MAIIGIQIDRENPEFNVTDYIFWMPQFKAFMETDEGKRYFEKLYPLVNNKIYKSIYGSDWELAMSYAISHYLTLISLQQQAPSGDTLESISGGGVTKGVLSSMSVGGFSKSYDLDRTMVGTDDALFWNQTSYGSALMALMKTKSIPSIFVVTSNPVCGAN